MPAPRLKACAAAGAKTAAGIDPDAAAINGTSLAARDGDFTTGKINR